MPKFTDEYAQPHIYDAEYGSYSEDLPFFLNLCTNGKVLDLACGTGRLTIPLSHKSEVVGLDNNKAMLEQAQKNGRNTAIQWIYGDMTQFQLNQSFDLITLAGNSFQALLTQEAQLNLFSSVKKHLKAASGIFAFDSRNDCTSTSDFEYWHTFQDVNVYGKQRYDTKSQVMTYTTKRVWPDHETLSKIELRYTSLEEIIFQIEKSDMNVINIYGDYQNSPYTQNSSSMVVTVKT